MERILQKYTRIARIFIIKRRLRSKVMDLHALSTQQIADLYLGDAILGEIRSLQTQLDRYVDGERRLPAHTSWPTNELK
jgi:hypothetical protein